MMCKKLWWILAFTSLATCLLGRSSTLAGRTEVCQRLHTFIISSDTNDTNRTSLTYMSMHSSEPVVITFEDPLPSPLLCGTNYDRCNAVVTSNTQETIRIVVFPLDTGIGLVSFNYSTRDDTLIYRDHFLLPQNVPDCTFIHFVVLVNVEIIGYCVELHPSKIRAFKIHVELLNLTKSLILRRQDTFEISDLSDITSLSNFVFFFQDRLDSCFNNEGNHVLFLNGGEIYDHSFFDGRISPFMYEGIDATCSSLHRVGSICNVVAHCNSSTLVFDTRGQEHNSIFTEAEYGQTFFCPSEDFISFRNGVLTLHDQSRVQFGNPVSFPLGEIYEGHCLNVDDNFFFVAIIDDGGTILVNFTDASYRGLGDCDFSTAVPPARVKDHFAIVNNGSDTQVYNLGLACMPEPLVLPRNFRLVTSFSTRTMDQCRCLEPSITTTISPSEPSVPEISPTLSSSPVVLVSDSPSTSTTSMLESQSMLVVSTSSTPTPTNEPASNGVDSPNVGGISSGVVAGAILMVAISLSIIITLLLIRKCYMSRKGNNSDNLELKTFSVDNVTNKEKVDSSLAENYEPKKQEIQKKESQEDETQVILIENHLQQSSDSLRTEVQARDLNREDLDTDSGSADTSTTLRDPPQNLSLVLHNVVCEETEVQPNSEGESDPQQITFDAEVHQDGNEEVSDSPDSPIMNLFPTFNTPPYPMYSAEPDSVENGVPVYTQPLADTSGESSQLLVTYTCVRPDLRRNGLENCTCNSSPTMTRDRNGVDESSILPLQNTDNSQARLVVGEVNCSSLFHPDDLWDRYHQHDDRTNTVQYRQLMTEVVGGSESLSNELEPNNDRHLTVNANVVRQISADNEHLTSDPDVLRQLSTDSEESRG